MNKNVPKEKFMQKLILLTLTVICCISIMPYKIYAADITVGATTWYAFGSRSENVKDDCDRENNNYAFEPTFLYGPALSVKFSNDFNLTFVYLYGKFNYKESYFETGGISDSAHDMKSRAARSDSDLALNYRLNDNFKAFAGIKYMSYEINLSHNVATVGNDKLWTHIKHVSIGPGLGFSSTFPITENIFMLATLSGFYLWSSGEEFNDYWIYGPKANLKVGYNEYGINSNLSVAYYISSFSTVISIGGRFQYFIIDYDKYEPFLINSITNKIYGITLTATYTFSL